MFFGLDYFQDSDSIIFDELNVVNNFYRIDLSNAKFDELHVYDNANEVYDTVKKDWDYKTELLAKFINNLEAGSVDLGGMPIEYVLFRKRKIDELIWQTVTIIPFDSVETIYEYVDRLVQATEIYEYQCVPLTATMQGKPISATVECDFDGLWLTGKDDQYQLLYNLELGDIEHVREDSLITTMSQYPVHVSSPVDYMQSSVRTMFLSDSTVKAYGKIDKRQERLAREKLLAFLKDGKPKILRDDAGRYYLVSVFGNPKEIPNNDLGRAIAEIEFQFVEIGNAFDNTTLEASTFLFSPPQLHDGGYYNANTPNLDTNSGYDGGDF